MEQINHDPRYMVEKYTGGNMRKHIWTAALLSMILSFGNLASVQAEIIPAYGEGERGYQAVVLCESLTVRQERSARSKAVKTLHYGDTLAVQDSWDGWARCFTSDNVDAGQTGWVNSDYIVVNPAWYQTDGATPVYAWNDTMAPKVALLRKGTVLPILKDEGEWLIVSLRGASGWIQKNAADRLAAETAETIRHIANLDRAELTTPKGAYTLSDLAGLRWIEENFSMAQPIGSAGCPFDAALTLYSTDGRTIVFQMATDSCSSFRTEDGSYFAYGNGDEALRLYGSTSSIGETFWRLFGLTNTYEDIYGS